MANKTYGQWCPVSRALDVVGERWTLLIVRDLGFGLRRFSELQSELIGISPSLLSSRLRRLTDVGVVDRVGHGYELTERGLDLLEVIHEVGRWGIELMDAPSESDAQSDFFPRAALGFMVRLESLPDLGLTAQFDLDERVHTLQVAPAIGHTRPRRRVAVTDGPANGPYDLSVQGTWSALWHYRRGQVSFDQLQGERQLVCDGDPSSVATLRQIFSPG